ncbi:acyltransferase domain-containing protein [Streptomyces sp. 8K308]|uniref:acyltransferase domain-containing protein n=1 Tax=Streptomyces sp. 8K308 TaxID=2530388 RepID=UPI00104D67FE|nr:acyltransferase domain-containing protein [Streptomyces sp. 8K308]TDC20150.1 acyltransferase domain-containing protein [Streptomyces sp. 8K308]
MSAAGGVGDVVVFSGQGGQTHGMGADLHRRFPLARAVFEEAADATGLDLARICFEDDPRLHLTEYTQPCLLTVEIAFHRVLTVEFGFAPRRFGGHSLGEYTALVAAGALPFAEAVRLVRRRGALMQQAVPEGRGAMAALVMDDILDSEAPGIVADAGVEVANYNSPIQIVVSGAADRVEGLRDRLGAALPDLTFIPLRVSIPSHCSLMRPARDRFAEHLAAAARHLTPERAAAVASNVTGGLHEPHLLTTRLADQLAQPVRWLDNMRTLAAGGPARIVELGPRPALAKFFGLIGVLATAVTNVTEVQATFGRPRPVPTTASTPIPATAPTVAPSATPGERLGSAAFRAAHGTRLAYAVGGTAEAAAGPALVSRAAGAGVLGYLDTARLDLGRATAEIERLGATLPAGAPWGVNVPHTPETPGRTEALLAATLRLGVPRIEVAGFTTPTRALVRQRLSGLHPGPDGRPRPARLLMARVGGVEAARAFLAPPPPGIVTWLRERGLITRAEAELAPGLPMADDLCAEDDRGGGLWALLPTLRRMRARAAGELPAAAGVRLGAAGGLGAPEAVAAAFALGADFVVTGSVNHCTAEADTSELVKDMLAAAGPGDFATAPDATLFEAGARQRVLRRGVFHPARAHRLHDLHLHHDDLSELAPADRERLERQLFRKDLDEVWHEVAADPDRWGSAVLARAEGSPRLRMALVFRWYLADSALRARRGDPAERLNFRVPCGPALGAFNETVRDTALADWRARHADGVARLLMDGAAGALRDHLVGAPG